MYGDPAHVDVWARYHAANRRRAFWTAVRIWLLYGAAALGLLSTGIVWPT